MNNFYSKYVIIILQNLFYKFQINLLFKATKDAGAIAGLNVLRIINEPTAAAIGHGQFLNLLRNLWYN